MRGDLRCDGPAAWGFWCPRCKEEAAATRLCRSFCQYRDQRGESPAGQGSFPAGFAGRKTPPSKSLDRICLNFETAEGEPSRRLLPRLCPLPGTNPGPGRVGAEGGRGRRGPGLRGGPGFCGSASCGAGPARSRGRRRRDGFPRGAANGVGRK